jgi:hypothetical protein
MSDISSPFENSVVDGQGVAVESRVDVFPDEIGVDGDREIGCRGTLIAASG